jgi:DNA ligase (NAD+)
MSLYTNEQFLEFISISSNTILFDLQEKCEDIFFNTGDESDLTDEQYDLLKDTLEWRCFDGKLKNGCKLRDDDNRVGLPVQLWSMDKVSNEDKLNKWVNKNKSTKYIIEEKLDGVSCLIVYKKNEPCKLYTRGDGIEGADISYLAPYLTNIPKLKTKNLVVRGELIISRSDFHDNYAGEFANARNMVSGCVNAKSLREGVKNINFVAYEIIDDVKSHKPSTNLGILDELGFETVGRLTPSSKFECTYGNMKMMLTEMKSDSPYEIDGIIIQSDEPYVRCTTGNPKYATAFKQSFDENIARTTIVAVHWEVTKWNLIKPRVEIQPVNLAGVVIRFVTAYNAKYVVDNMIGVGAVIDVTRSGDVIPKIVAVIEPATAPGMPTIDYEWNSTNVDVQTCEVNMLSDVKMTTGFFDKIGAKHVGEKTIHKFYTAGFMSIIEILKMTEQQMVDLDGFGTVLAKRTYTNIHGAISNTKLDVLIGSSGVLGYGFSTKKVKKLLDGIPDLFNDESVDGLLERIMTIDGFSEKSAKKIVENLPTAGEFIKMIEPFTGRLIVGGETEAVADKGVVVISGFRDSDFEKKLVVLGYKIGSTVSKKTKYVITVPDCKPSAKIVKANELGIEIVNKDDFINQV